MLTENTEQRKLAAIMFTDMVGYSALAQRNEKLALALLVEHRRLLREFFPRFGGREVETTGDGFLVEFASALEAAQCAIEIQRTLATRNISVPRESQIQLRIGIHVGDVVCKDGHVLGDCVNIAARLQPLAEPGGICISVDVERQIRNTIEASLVKLGAAELKNIQAPMELFRIVLPWEKAEARTGEREASERARRGVRPLASAMVAILLLILAGWWLVNQVGKGSKPVASLRTNSLVPLAAAPEDGIVDQMAIAVLPFVNLSSDKENDYLCDGFAEDVITALTQLKGLRVPARTSSFIFKGKNEDIRRIGEQLRVATVLEGSIRKVGSTLRITAQLIKVSDGFHLWSEHYDRELTNIIVAQNEVEQKVIDALKVHLGVGDAMRLAKRPTENPEALDLYLKGRFYWNLRSAAGFSNAIVHFNQAINLDTNYALAYVGLADTYVIEDPPKARRAAEKALEIDQTLAEAHAALGFIAMRYDYKWSVAEEEIKKAIKLQPNYVPARQYYCNLLMSTGRSKECLAQVKETLKLDPLSLPINWTWGLSLYLSGQYQAAIDQLNKTIQMNPNFALAYSPLGLAYACNGNYADAISTFKKMRDLPGDLRPRADAGLGYTYALAGKRSEAEKILAESVKTSPPYLVAQIYTGLGRKAEAIKCLDQAADQKELLLINLKVEPIWDSLRLEPRFTEVLKKVGL